MTPTHTPGTSPTALVVDDEEPIRLVVRRILEEHGYAVTEATDGLDAIALLAGGMPLALLLADLHMPGLGGEERALGRRARARTAGRGGWRR